MALYAGARSTPGLTRRLEAFVCATERSGYRTSWWKAEKQRRASTVFMEGMMLMGLKMNGLLWRLCDIVVSRVETTSLNYTARLTELQAQKAGEMLAWRCSK